MWEMRQKSLSQILRTKSINEIMSAENTHVPRLLEKGSVVDAKHPHPSPN